MRRVDWPQFCRSHGIPMGDTRKGQWLEVRCPFCGDQKTKGAIHLNSGAYHCWKCGKHSIFDFVSSYTLGSNDPRDIYHELEPYFSEDTSSYTPAADRKAEEREFVIRIKIDRSRKGLKVPGRKPLSKAMKRYLRKRGFNATYLSEKYDLHDGGVSGDWAWRLIIPIYVDGKVVSWQGRHIGDSKLRYMAASLEKSLNIKNFVYNLDNCHKNVVIAVEGIFDCWRLGDDCVAMFGISVKDGQLRLLADRFDEIYFFFDPEEEAQQRARECAEKIVMLGKKAYVITMSDTESSDPGELTAEEVLQVKREVFGHVPDDELEVPWLRRKEK